MHYYYLLCSILDRVRLIWYTNQTQIVIDSDRLPSKSLVTLRIQYKQFTLIILQLYDILILHNSIDRWITRGFLVTIWTEDSFVADIIYYIHYLLDFFIVMSERSVIYVRYKMLFFMNIYIMLFENFAPVCGCVWVDDL